MRNITRIIAAIVTVAVCAVMLAPTVSANNGNPPDRHLSLEPVPLSVDGNQFTVTHIETPTACTVLVNGNCAESVELWSCPAGPLGLNPLSLSARQRLNPPTYAQILVTGPVASRSTHCVLDTYVPRKAPAPDIKPVATAVPVVPVTPTTPVFTG